MPTCMLSVFVLGSWATRGMNLPDLRQLGSAGGWLGHYGTTMLQANAKVSEVIAESGCLFHPNTRERIHRRPFDPVSVVSFTLNGHSFTSSNSNLAEIRLTESASFQLMCDTREEVDHYWDQLSQGGDERKQVCGWLREKYGVSWQVVPSHLTEIMGNADPTRRGRAMEAYTSMKKIVIQDVLDAAEGKGGDASEP